MTHIKICGVRHPEHALAAAEAGADFIGVIFAPMSSRRVTPEQARAVSAALAQRGEKRPRVVGIFVNEDPAEMDRLANCCSLDLIQLSGDEPWDLCHRLSRPAIKALRVPATRSAASLLEELEQELPPLQAAGGHCLLESHVPGRYGGTGRQMDMRLAAAASPRFPFLLSGGLNPENVASAVRLVRPLGVDVSSGVETAGAKDPEKIRAFIAAVRKAESGLPSLMRAEDAAEVLDILGRAGVPVWVDGAWGVDALLGRQTRPHADLDLALSRQDVPMAQRALRPLGFSHDPDATPGLPARVVLRDGRGRQIDLHPLVFDGSGDGRQELGGGRWGLYPRAGLLGIGTIAGRPVRCLTADLQLRFHQGYDPDEKDLHDMRLLAQHCGLRLPAAYARGDVP